MANKFEIRIVALDKFTATFKKLKTNATQAMRPLLRTQQNIRVLFKEMALPKVLKGFQAVSRAAQTMADGLGKAASPLADIVGLGAAGITGVVAAVVALTAAWGRAGFQVAQTSRMIGVSREELQRYSGVARLLGIDTDQAVNAIHNLSSKVYASRFEDTGTRVLLGSANIAPQYDEKGKLKLGQLLSDIAGFLDGKAPQLQERFTQGLGIPELLPALNHGREGVKALADEINKLGSTQSDAAIDKASRLTLAVNRLGEAARGSANALSDMLSGPATRAVDFVTDSLTGNKRTPAQKEASSANPLNWLLWAAELGQSIVTSGEGAPTGSRRASGVVTNTSDGAPGTGPLNPLDGGVGAGTLLDDYGNPKTKYSSEEVKHRVEVYLNMGNMPPGTTAKATSNGAPVQVRIAHAMPAGSLP